MTVLQSLLSFSLAAALLTLTPGLDTALVLRTAMADGRRAACRAALGIAAGLLCWGAVVAMGLGALVLASPLGFTALQLTGAAYLSVLGCRMILAPRRGFEPGDAGATGGAQLLRRGLLTNLLNPKVGVFYVSFLPQFVPHGVSPGPFMIALATLHAAMAVVWLCGLAVGAHRVTGPLRRVSTVRTLDRATGAVFLAFGLRLALAPRG